MRVAGYKEDSDVGCRNARRCKQSARIYGILSLMYVMQMLANVGEKAENIKYFTFFTLFDYNGIAAGETDAFLYSVVLLVGAIVLFVSGIEVFARKDLCL